jgi:hypothetical protein
MGLIYDNPDLAARTPTRLAAEEADGSGGLEGRMLDYLDSLEPRNGTYFLKLHRPRPVRFAAEVEALEGLDGGS